MEPITTTLCTVCGLCCDGSLLADVELRNAKEALAVESMGLQVEDDDDTPRQTPVMLLPCRALKKRCCSIYAHRPRSCRDFECRVLIQVREVNLSLKSARSKIESAHSKIAELKTLIKDHGGAVKGKTFFDTWTDFLSQPIHSKSEVLGKIQRKAIATDKFLQETFLECP